MTRSEPKAARTAPGRPGPADLLARVALASVGYQRASLERPVGPGHPAHDAVLRASLSPQPLRTRELLATLAGYRVTAQEVVDLYVPEVARSLGAMWLGSEASFADVTIAALRLQTLLDAASDHLALIRRPGRHEDLMALVVVPEGEHHFLGALVAAAQLRAIGVEVFTAIGEPEASVVERISRIPPDILLLSCPRLESVVPVAQLVAKLRARLSAPPLIAVGGCVSLDDALLLERTGADVASRDIHDLPPLCFERAASRGTY